MDATHISSTGNTVSRQEARSNRRIASSHDAPWWKHPTDSDTEQPTRHPEVIQQIAYLLAASAVLSLPCLIPLHLMHNRTVSKQLSPCS